MKLRPRLSLLNLLLVTAIAALSLALWRHHEQLVPLQAKIKKLREEIGEVAVADPEKAYVQPLGDVYDTRFHFRWRAYVPPGREASLEAQVDGSSLGLWLGAGETSFDLRFEPDIDRNRQGVWFRTLPDHDGGGAGGSINGVPPWLGPLKEECEEVVSHDPKQGVGVGETLVLMHRRGRTANGDPTEVLVTLHLR